MNLSHALEPRYLIGGCVVTTVLFIVLIARQGVRTYQNAFVATVAAGLKQNFIVANPQSLFALSVVLTLVLGTLGYVTIGPVGAVGAAWRHNGRSPCNSY